MPHRWVLARVAETPEVIANSVLIQIHVPVLVDACVARWRLQLAGRLALASTVSIGIPRKPRPHAQAALGVGPGHIHPFIAKNPRRSGHGVYSPQQATEPLLLNPHVWSCPALTECDRDALPSAAVGQIEFVKVILC